MLYWPDALMQNTGMTALLWRLHAEEHQAFCRNAACMHWRHLSVSAERCGVVQMLVAGWRALSMVSRGEFVGIMGFASMDWLVSDIATTYVGGVMSPLPTNILVEDIKHLILEAEVRIIWGAPAGRDMCHGLSLYHLTWPSACPGTFHADYLRSRCHPVEASQVAKTFLCLTCP